jgi:hypothetical protein
MKLPILAGGLRGAWWLPASGGKVLRGGAGIIGRHRPWVFLSTHGEESHGACLRWLRDQGYRVEPILGKDVDAATEVLAAPGGA